VTISFRDKAARSDLAEPGWIGRAVRRVEDARLVTGGG